MHYWTNAYITRYGREKQRRRYKELEEYVRQSIDFISNYNKEHKIEEKVLYLRLIYLTKSFLLMNHIKIYGKKHLEFQQKN